MNEEGIQVPATVELSTSPELATKKGIQAVTQLMKLLDQKEKPVIINGKRHMEFDDWIILGNFYGIDVRTGDAEPVEIFDVRGAKAKAEVIRVDDGVVIGGAEAYCLSDERNWKGKPWFQLASMAQTRAGSKALANVLRGFVALKGISGTPAEEMINRNDRKPAPPKQARKAKPQPQGKDGFDEDMPKAEKGVDAEISNPTNWIGLRSENETYAKVLDKVLVEMNEGDMITDHILRRKATDMMGEQELTPQEKKEVYQFLRKNK